MCVLWGRFCRLLGGRNHGSATANSVLQVWSLSWGIFGFLSWFFFFDHAMLVPLFCPQL